jgi:peptidoglycan/LPS O-acetylase OafA/YrhL
MNLLKIYSETTNTGEVIIDDTWYSPGVVGFLATFGLAAVSLLIIWDLVRRIRRVRYRAEISALLDQEQASDNANGNPER